MPAFQWSGLGAYALGALAAWSSPVLPPVVGVGVAFLAHALISRLFPAAEGVPEQS